MNKILAHVARGILVNVLNARKPNAERGGRLSAAWLSV